MTARDLLPFEVLVAGVHQDGVRVRMFRLGSDGTLEPLMGTTSIYDLGLSERPKPEDMIPVLGFDGTDELVPCSELTTWLEETTRAIGKFWGERPELGESDS